VALSKRARADKPPMAPSPRIPDDFE